jgi:hypothetical protein
VSLGLFLRSLEDLLTPPFTLSGFDIMRTFFPSSHPPHTTYAIHNLAEEWPVEMHGKYDLVHQRLAILGAGRTVTPQKAASFLDALVAPGGWIQLGELDVREPASGGRAMHDAMAVIRAVFDCVCSTNDFAHSMDRWLVEDGFEDVRKEVYEVDLGPRCKDPVVGKRAIEVMVQSWEALLGAAQREYMPCRPYSFTSHPS